MESSSSAGEDTPLVSPLFRSSGPLRLSESGLKMSKEERQQLGSPRYTPLKTGEVLLNSIFDSAEGQVCITVNKLYTHFMNYVNTDMKVRISVDIAHLTDPTNKRPYQEFTTGIRKWKHCIEFSDEFAFALLDNFPGPYTLKLTLCTLPPHGIVSATGKATLSIFVGESKTKKSDAIGNDESTLTLTEDVMDTILLTFEPFVKVFITDCGAGR